MIEGLCPNRTFPIKHLLKDCGLMQKFLLGSANKGEQGKEPAPTADDAEEKDDTERHPHDLWKINGQ